MVVSYAPWIDNEPCDIIEWFESKFVPDVALPILILFVYKLPVIKRFEVVSFQVNLELFVVILFDES